MLWELRFGRDGFAIEPLLERGQPLPQWFQDEPLLAPGEEFYLSSFFELTTERAIGWASGPIPHSKILEYGERAGLEVSTMSVFTQVIRAMDTAYLDWLAAEREKASKRGKD